MEIGRNDWNSKLITYFVRNTRLVLLVLAAIIIGGTFSLISLRREGFPKVQPKVVSITTVYPGASSNEVESQITKLIESSVKDAANVADISSSSATGFSGVIVNLVQTADLDLSVQNIRSKLSAVSNDLPEDAQEPQVQIFATGGSDFIVGVYGFEDSTLLKSQSDKLIESLSEVSGVKEVKEVIAQDERLVITYKPEILAANKITASQIESILQGSNLDLPLSRIDVDGKNQTVVSQGSYRSKEDFEKQIISVGPNGKPLLLKDVAVVSLGTNSVDQFQRVGVLEGKKLVTERSVLLKINITSEADILVVKDKLDKRIKEIRDDNIIEKKTRIKFLLDTSQTTKDQIDEIVSGAVGDKNTLYILGGVQLVLLAMLSFVNYRAALVAAAVIPLSFFFTLLWLFISGLQLNTIVLFSLILVLGLIVDPAIVILESIQRYKDLGRKGIDAVVETGRRYGAGLFIAVLTSIIVFIPFGVVSGILGEIIKYIPATVVPALIASYFIPIAILPVFAAFFLKGKKQSLLPKNEDADLWPAAALMMRFNSWVLKSNLRKIAVLVVMVVLIALSSTFLASGSIPIVQFSSPSDNNSLLVSVRFPKGTTAATKDILAKDVESKINDRLGIENYFYYNQTDDTATLNITLQKNREAENSSKKILSRLEEAFSEVKGVEIISQELSVGPPESEFQIQVQLFDNDIVVLENAAKDVGKYLKKKSEIEKIDDGFTDKGDPQILITIDKKKLATFGLSVFEVDQTLKSYLDEKKITKFNDLEKDKSREVFLKPAKETLPKTKQEIDQLQITTKTGQKLPLGSISSVKETSVLDNIQRFNGKRFVNVKARLKNSNDLIKVQRDLDNYLDKDKLNALGIDSKGNQGEFDGIAKSFRELFIALAAAIFLTYVVLVLQFGSFSQPVIMLFTIPLAAVGVFPALFLVGGQLGFLEIVGFTILVGIVENVAIFLIDYANQLIKERGMSLKDAIVLSSGVRFRPIILTKVVALGGLLPLAIFSPFWRGLSSVIIGGILVSGFLSMTVIPIFYTWFGALRGRTHRIFHK